MTRARSLELTRLPAPRLSPRSPCPSSGAWLSSSGRVRKPALGHPSSREAGAATGHPTQPSPAWRVIASAAGLDRLACRSSAEHLVMRPSAAPHHYRQYRTLGGSPRVISVEVRHSMPQRRSGATSEVTLDRALAGLCWTPRARPGSGPGMPAPRQVTRPPCRAVLVTSSACWSGPEMGRSRVPSHRPDA